MTARGVTGVPDIRDEIVWVYALAHPDTGEIYYVGRSANPHRRLENHTKRGAHAVRAWLASLGKSPTLRLLQLVPPGDDSDIAERVWLRGCAELGHPLLNYMGVPFPLRSGVFQRLRATTTWFPRVFFTYGCAVCGKRGHNRRTCGRAKQERAA